jgi:hypothetical protein
MKADYYCKESCMCVLWLLSSVCITPHWLAWDILCSKCPYAMWRHHCHCCASCVTLSSGIFISIWVMLSYTTHAACDIVGTALTPFYFQGIWKLEWSMLFQFTLFEINGVAKIVSINLTKECKYVGVNEKVIFRCNLITVYQ